jgi:hypothetical protein
VVRSPAEASRALEAATARLSAARGWRRWLLPPLVAWLVANAVFAVTAVYGGDNPFDAHTWTSWDSPIYLGIAQDGYTSYECPQAELDQGAWACGNFGWFPLYPALIAPFLHAGLDGEAVGVAISSLFWLGLLIVVWRGLLLPAAGRATLPALALATFAPGAFYFHTVYPVSMAACLLAIALVCLRDHRWWGAGGAAALGGRRRRRPVAAARRARAGPARADPPHPRRVRPARGRRRVGVRLRRARHRTVERLLRRAGALPRRLHAAVRQLAGHHEAALRGARARVDLPEPAVAADDAPRRDGARRHLAPARTVT